MAKTYQFLLIGLMTLSQSENIQAGYIPHQVELQNTIKNQVRDINNHGTIVGQLHTVDPITKEELIVDYFWDLKQPEPVVLTTEAHEGHLPVINNKGQVAGIIKRKSTDWWQGDDWWQRDTRELYRYDPNEGLTILSKPLGANFGDIVIVSITDDAEIIICDNQDYQEAEHFSVISDDDSLDMYSNPRYSSLKLFLINRKGEALVSYTAEGEKFPYFYYRGVGSVLYTYLAQIRGTIGIGLNEKHQIIAKDKNETTGYFLQDQYRGVNLGSFIPIALNNHGEILGKKEGSFFLRKTNGSMINLNSVSNEKLEDVTGISDDGHIVGITNIDGQKKVIFLEHTSEN